MFLQGPSKTGSKNGFLRSMPAKYTRARRGACLHHEARHDNKYTCICPSCRRVSSPCMHDRILSSQPRLIRADRSTNAVTCLPSRQQFGGLSEFLILPTHPHQLCMRISILRGEILPPRSLSTIQLPLEVIIHRSHCNTACTVHVKHVYCW